MTDTGRVPAPVLAGSTFTKSRKPNLRKDGMPGVTIKQRPIVKPLQTQNTLPANDKEASDTAPTIPEKSTHAHAYKQTAFVGRALAREKKAKTGRAERSKMIAANRA